MALIYRAHFAFSKNPIVNSKGLNTSAIYGFLNTLLELLRKEKPTHLAIAFDTKAPTFRTEIFNDYKANRERQPEDIQVAIPIIKKLIKLMNIKVYTTRGCYYCEQVKELFKRANLLYESWEVIPQTGPPDEPPTGVMWKSVFSQKYPGVQGFPYVIIDDKPIGALVETAKYLLKEGLVSARKD